MNVALVIAQIFVALLAGTTLCFLVLLILSFIDIVISRVSAYRRAHVARIEAELDARQAELRQAVLALAEQLAADRDETSKCSSH